MECSKKPVWNDFTKEELERIAIPALDEESRRNVLRNWDAVAKPIDAMGRFETLTAQIGAILGTDVIDLAQKAVIIMCSDNGIVEEGISQSGQEITAVMTKVMGRGASSVGRMAEGIGADTIPVDIGVNREEPIPGVLSRKIRRGTRNFSREPAMTERETLQAVAAGIDIVFSCRERGYKILAAGEMGIGNTTTSSAVTAALLRCGADRVTGRGAGLSDAGLLRKRQVISHAIQKYDLYHADPLTVLETVGGLDIAGLAGVCIGAALCRLPVVLDGAISMAAALCAERMLPGTKAYFIPSHKGKEPAAGAIAEELGLEPVIDGALALGEGVGAVMMLSLLDAALSVYHRGTTFEEIQMEQYKRMD